MIMARWSKMQFSQVIPVHQHRLTTAWLMFKKIINLRPFIVSRRTNNHWKESSIIIVLDSRSDSRHVSVRIEFFDYCLQSSQI
jgi:hypothetical protein